MATEHLVKRFVFSTSGRSNPFAHMFAVSSPDFQSILQPHAKGIDEKSSWETTKQQPEANVWEHCSKMLTEATVLVAHTCATNHGDAGCEAKTHFVEIANIVNSSLKNEKLRK